jgi:hypothetical protein
MKCGIFDGITSIIPQSKDKYGDAYTIREAFGLDDVDMLPSHRLKSCVSLIHLLWPQIG